MRRYARRERERGERSIRNQARSKYGFSASRVAALRRVIAGFTYIFVAHRK